MICCYGGILFIYTFIAKITKVYVQSGGLNANSILYQLTYRKRVMTTIYLFKLYRIITYFVNVTSLRDRPQTSAPFHQILKIYSYYGYGGIYMCLDLDYTFIVSAYRTNNHFLTSPKVNW